MCGILCILCKKCENSSIYDIFNELQNNVENRGPDFTGSKTISLSFNNNCFNLLLKASVLWLQGAEITPQPIENDKSIFLYNGDIFGGEISAEDRARKGDTVLLLKLFENSIKISESLSKIKGPYAFIYFDKISKKLYFGRDIFGRRSLLIGKKDDALLICSVAKRNVADFIELPSIGTFCYDFEKDTISLMPWQYKNDNFYVKLKELNTFLNKDIKINQEIFEISCKAFKNPADLSIINSLKSKSVEDIFAILLNSCMKENVEKLQNLLEKAIEKRIKQPNFCKNCLLQKIDCNHALVGLLFSGGVDCTILALITDKLYCKSRPIDLINVSFDEIHNYESPDRLTGLKSFEELKKLCPNRVWNFVEINIPRIELENERKSQIADLIYPLNTILDDSLGCALWFASRGKTSFYISPCRVLIVGMGADELFGGYTRHKAALNKESWLGLHRILQEDWQNISFRNLARDDRVVSDHGRQLRTPYLDEDVVEFARNLNCWEKTIPLRDIPEGCGEKILLRCLAFYLGLRKAAAFKKRAFQFGSRIANSKEKAHEISPRLL